MFGIWQTCCYLGTRGIRQEYQRPHSGRGKLDETDAPEARAPFCKERLKDLLQAVVDGSNDRHAVENVLAHLDELATDKIGGQEAKQCERDESKDEPGTGNCYRQIGLGPVRDRNEGPH